MYCNRCGAYMPDDAEFCPSCGTRAGGVSVRALEPARGCKSVVIVAIIAVAAVLVASMICFTVYTRSRQETQLAAVQGTQQGGTDDSSAVKRADSTAPSDGGGAQDGGGTDSGTTTATVTNNYYYYGSGAAHDNDYYTRSSDSGFLWPTDTQYISTSDLRGLSEDTVAAIRNEIYARYGYAFKTERWQRYFAAKTWYTRDETCTDETVRARMSTIELANLSTIVSYEESRGCR